MSRPHSSFWSLPIRGLFAVPALLSGVPVAALGAAVWTPSAVWGLSEPPPELRFTGTYQGAPTLAAADEVEGGEVPGAPQRFEARPGNTQVRLEWAAPEDESITGYEVRQRVAGSSGGSWSGWRAISGSGALTTSHVVGKLVNGEKYLFQLRAVNAVGEGAASKRKGATPMGALTVAVGDGRMVEGDEGKKEMEFKVSLSGETVHDVKLQATAVAGADSTATATAAGRDFLPLSQSVVFAAYGRQHGKREDVNDLEQTVRVEVVGDRLAEGDESFQLRLDNLESEDKRVTLAGGGEKTSAVGVIVDDDAAPVLAPLADVTVTAGQEVATTAAATDADGDSLSYTWSRKATESTPALPQGTVLNQAGLTFTPTAAGVYTMTVTADDGHGNTATEEVTVTVSAPVIPAPAKPTGFKATGGNRQVTLTWDNPGNAQITQWQVQQKTGSGNYGSWGAISGSGAATVSHTVTGLRNGTAYGFKIRAVAGTVEGAASDAVSATPKETIAPRLSATAQDGVDGQCPYVDLSWTVGDTDPRAMVEYANRITGWNLESRLLRRGREAVWRHSARRRPGMNVAQTRSVTQIPCVGEYDNGVEYRLRAKGQDAEGRNVFGPWSNVVRVRPRVDSSAPWFPRPTKVKASGGDQQVTLSWVNPNYIIESFQIQKKAGSGQYGPWTNIDGSGASTTSHTVTGLTNGIPYSFRIRAVYYMFSYGGSGVSYISQSLPSYEVSATPLDPNRPTVFAVPGNQQVTLRWSHPGDAKITKWQVQQKTSSGSWGSWVDISVSSTNWPTGMRVSEVDCEFFEWCPSYRVTGLTNGTSYGFRIRSVAGNVVGGASEEVRSTPKGVTAPTLSIKGDYNVSGYYGTSLTWTVADLDPYAIVENAGRIREWIVEWRYPGSQWSLSRVEPHLRLKKDTTYHAFLRKDLDLRNGTQVEFRVRAKGELRRSDTAIYGPWSNTVTVTLGTPPKLTNVSASSGRYREVPLSWDNPGNAHIIRKYQYEQNGNGKWIDISGSGAATTSHTVTGLASGTAYSFRIRAVNGAGAGEASEPVKATPDLSSVVPPSPFLMLWPGKTATICNVDDSQCDSTNYKSRGSQKKVWRMYVSLGRDLPLYKPTGLQIQYLRTDRLEEGPSEWIDTGWCLGADCDGPINAPWPGLVDKSRWSQNDESAHIMYEPVPYEISVRVRMVNAVGVGHASQWITFKGGESSIIRHAHDEGARISISDATVQEAAGAELAFTVTLDRSQSQRPQSGLLHVRYATRDVTGHGRRGLHRHLRRRELRPWRDGESCEGGGAGR